MQQTPFSDTPTSGTPIFYLVHMAVTLVKGEEEKDAWFHTGFFSGKGILVLHRMHEHTKEFGRVFVNPYSGNCLILYLSLASKNA